MDVADVREAKRTAEEVIGDRIADVLEKFYRLTGVPVDWVRVDLREVRGMGDPDARHVVAGVRLGLSL